MESNDIRIRAFRAPDDLETCEKFIIGHRKVLENHGIKKVSSTAEKWVSNPSIFVIAVESLDKTKLYGGGRLHVADGNEPLPIELATGPMDSKIHDYVRYYAQEGTGEICGLWNSKEVAGLGIGSVVTTRCLIVIGNQLGLNTIFSLCSPLTLRVSFWVGCSVFTKVGNEGTFYYPKIDLLATTVLLEEVPTFKNALPRERDKMRYLKDNLNCVLHEKSPFKNIDVNVSYDLEVPVADVNQYKLKQAI